MISYIKQAHRNLTENEYIIIRLIEDIEIKLIKTDKIAGDDNTLIINRANGNMIIINTKKIIICQNGR